MHEEEQFSLLTRSPTQSLTHLLTHLLTHEKNKRKNTSCLIYASIGTKLPKMAFRASWQSLNGSPHNGIYKIFCRAPQKGKENCALLNKSCAQEK